MSTTPLIKLPDSGSVESAKSSPITDELLSSVRQFLRDQRVQPGPSAAVLNDWEKFHLNMRAFTWALLNQSNIRRDDREDCAQEVWLEIVSGLPEWRGPIHAGSFLCWVKKVARTKAADWHRRNERQLAASTTLRALRRIAPDSANDDPVMAAERTEEAARLKRGMEILRQAVSPSTAFVIELRYLEDKSIREICSTLQKTPQQVYDRERRGLAKLRTILSRLLNPFGTTNPQE